jgi:signal peptidase I
MQPFENIFNHFKEWKNKKNSNKKEKQKEDLVDFIKTTLIAIVVMLFVRYFIIQPFYVRGSSMEPNFYEKEYLIVDELSYRFSTPQRGDIVVFKLKNSEYNEYLIKRIIGLPGEKVIIKDGKVIIKNSENKEGFVLKEDYLPEGRTTQGQISEDVSEDSYYVLGDNRDVSYDSRYFGSINRSSITGKVLLRGWPVNRAGIIKMGRY